MVPSIKNDRTKKLDFFLCVLWRPHIPAEPGPGLSRAEPGAGPAKPRKKIRFFLSKKYFFARRVKEQLLSIYKSDFFEIESVPTELKFSLFW